VFQHEILENFYCTGHFFHFYVSDYRFVRTVGGTKTAKYLKYLLLILTQRRQLLISKLCL